MHLTNLATGIIGGLAGAIWAAGGGYGFLIAFLAYALFGAMALMLSLAATAFGPSTLRSVQVQTNSRFLTTNPHATGSPSARPQPHSR